MKDLNGSVKTSFTIEEIVFGYFQSDPMVRGKWSLRRPTLAVAQCSDSFPQHWPWMIPEVVGDSLEDDTSMNDKHQQKGLPFAATQGAILAFISCLTSINLRFLEELDD